MKNTGLLDKIMLISQVLVTTPITMGIAFLFFNQIQIVRRNTTNVEFSVRKWQEIDARELKITDYKWAYDFGLINNIKSVLG
jgi:hypothetical protein